MELNIKGRVRTSKGKNAAGRDRRAGLIPANLIFGGESHPISVETSVFNKLLQSGLRQSSIINLSIEGGEASVAANRVIVKEIQREPVSGAVRHIDFYRLETGKKVLVKVSVELQGSAKGVKAGGAMEHYIRTLKVRATPESLQDIIPVEVSNLDVGEAMFLQDLPIPSDWDVVMEGNPIICRIARSRLTATQTPGES